jgi:MFS family permease
MRRMNVFAKGRLGRGVPAECRSNFIHLYLDIAWFGLLSGSAMAFASVFATRQGATSFQLGLLSAGPGLVSLLFTVAAGRWLDGQRVDRAVVVTSVGQRLGYLLWALLPFLLAPAGQVWALIVLSLLMNVPATGLAMGFNALFADAVPQEWRGHVAGVRNALMALVYVVTSLVCGALLERVPFPTGYQIVFAMGFVGGAMSTFHLSRIRLDGCRAPSPPEREGTGRRPRAPFADLRFDVLRGSVKPVVVITFFFHLTLFFAIPIFPLRMVEGLHLGDEQIGVGTAVFYAALFVGSLLFDRFSNRWGNRRMVGMGATFISLYPALLALARGPALYLVGSSCAGFGWSLAGAALNNYLLASLPQEERTKALGWYNMAVNAAVLLGSLVGPLGAERLGVVPALLLYAGLRMLVALAILAGERRRAGAQVRKCLGA